MTLQTSSDVGVRQGVGSVCQHNLNVALKWAEVGAYIFVAGVNKRPRVKWRDESTKDPDTIKGWFDQWPDALPAIDLAKSGHVVIDGDRHGGPDGVAAVERLFAEHKLNTGAIPTIITPQDGRHYWFKQPIDGEPLGNSDKPIRDKAINVRGAGGYVIAPGARLPDGKQYKRDKNTPSALESVRRGAVPVLPPSIETLLRPNGHDKASPISKGSRPGLREEAYAKATLDNIARELDRAAPGARNIELNNAALRMGHMVASGWIGRATVEGRLFDAATACGLAKDDGAQTVRATIKSDLDAGEKEPHAPLHDRPLNGHNVFDRALGTDNKELVSICAADVKMKVITWLWPDRFAIGKLGIIAGLPDEGKGQTLSYMIAQVTNGGEWPMNEGQAPQGNVILFSDEDDVADTIVPRLEAAGANRKRVHIIKMVHADGTDRLFSLVTDLDALRRKIQSIVDVKLVIIDPISAYLGVGKVDSFRTPDVRAVLTPLVTLAAEMKIAIIGVMHFNKKMDVTNALLRISDSLAFGAVARHVYGVIDDVENDRKLFVRAKNNVSAKSKDKTLAYRFGGREVGKDHETGETILAPHIIWELNYVDVTAVEAMQAAVDNKSPGARDVAKKFLDDMLAKGPVLKTEIEEAAEANSISEKTLRRAKEKLGVVAYKDRSKADGKWYWQLPSSGPSNRWSGV
jgi:Bifunctional DNA primase/polymerase, N-terminal/AAA domain